MGRHATAARQKRLIPDRPDGNAQPGGGQRFLLIECTREQIAQLRIAGRQLAAADQVLAQRGKQQNI